ncbi:CoA transferase [Georgenia yuyongxinii]|uniref:CoA transferase n=1 Tax=Georgenia yuyongxinii TaxID=2589797 RepID=A0A5B8BZM4_9MICO|nr:CoA transferase [Georgenia yuyongxinii]QDC23774.1 CoA transferase [Georgenia yuyongxinii]
MTSQTLPLAGIRVLDVTHSVAGPFTTMLLADLGADVIKVERAGAGDDTRAWGPPFWDGTSTAFLAFNRNKRSIELDLKSDDGKDVLTELVRSADVLVHNGLTHKRESLGLTFEQVEALNAEIIYCSITAYGATGPLERAPGYDSLLQARGGLMSVTGEPGAPPVRVGTSIIDMGTGFWSVIGVLAALLSRQRGTPVRRVETSLYETAVTWMSHSLTSYFANGQVPERSGSGTAMIAPYEAFRARDGFFMLAANNDSLFTKACRAVGLDALLQDERFTSNPDRVRHRAQLRDELNAAFAGWSVAELVDTFDAVGVPVAPIQDMAQLAVDPQAEALGLIRAVDHAEIDGYRVVGSAFSLDGARPATTRVPPSLGEHGAEILAELGIPASNREDSLAEHSAVGAS